MEMLSVTNLDKNLINSAIKENDVLWSNGKSEPFSLHGVFFSEEEKVFRRLPKELAKRVSPAVGVLSKHTSGGRIRFRSSSPYVALKIIMPVENFGSNLSLLATYGFSVYSDGVFMGNVRPEYKHFKAQDNGYFTFEGIVRIRNTNLKNIDIYFPTYSMVSEIYIGLKEGSEPLAPIPYKIEKPIVFYGSSTTQGACASRAGNDYSALISRWYNSEYINLGFSGNGNGEDTMGDYLASLDASVYALDYGMNAKDLNWLKDNHYSFYKKLRKAKPDTPIVFITRTFYNDPDKFLPRHEIAKETFNKAIAEGDKNIYFFDGTSLRDKIDWDYATVDNSHPNDIGFYEVAKNLKPIFNKIFSIEV